MNRMALWAIGLVLGMLFSASAISGSKCVILSKEDTERRGARLSGLLKDKSFAALEDELGARLKNVERSTESDEMLRLDYQAAFKGNASMEPLLSEWIRLYPRSYPAHVARAVYYVETGYAKRGRAFASRTSEEQLAAMRREFEKAGVDLHEALGLAENPTLVYAELMLIGRAFHEANKVPELVGQINDKAPKSLAVKVAAAFALNPKWGGSLEQLDGLVAAAEAAKMAPLHIITLKYRVELGKADYYEIVTKQLARAADHFLKAGELCGAYDAWDGAVRTSYDIEDWATVVEAADSLIKSYPTDNRTFARRGWAYEKTDRLAQAIKDYEVAAALGDSWAQNKMGWMLWQGVDVAKDVGRARKLFEQAAAQGNKTAQANLKALNAAVGTSLRE